MKILVSACLLGENCKYSGGNNYSEKAAAFVQGHEVIPVCPEVLGGLSVPRTPAEIVNGEVVTKDGVSVDAAFRAGAARALAIAKENGVELAILQPRSTSWCWTLLPASRPAPRRRASARSPSSRTASCFDYGGYVPSLKRRNRRNF